MSEQSTARKPVGVLHFFPGAKRIIWVVRGKAVVVGEAWGGEEPQPGVDYGKMKPRKTTAGRYVIHSYGPYKTKTWELARIGWGTQLQMRDWDAGGYKVQRLYYRTGLRRTPWKLVEETAPGASLTNIKKWFNELYGEHDAHDQQGRTVRHLPDQRALHDKNHDGVPDTWIFNEFGPWSVRYFRDTNHDGVLDGDEHLMGELIHTIPVNEEQVERGVPVRFTPSHGCVHISPIDREKFRKAGAFKKGNSFIVHRYSEPLPKQLAGAGQS
jgi:hypothetical protein